MSSRAIHGTLSLVLFGLVLTGPVHSDIIELNDGKRFEGVIVSEEPERVRMEIRVGRTRATIGFRQEQIAKIERKPAPASFDGDPIAKRQSNPKNFKRDDRLYLEIPIIGSIGKQVFASGILKVLRYANRYGVRHIVFNVDSTDGEIDEALEIYDILRQFKDRFKYHAIVRGCLGGALAVAVWCDAIHVVPGAKIGGLGKKLNEVSSSRLDKFESDDEDVIRAQLAHQVITETGKRGRCAQVLRAMLEPSEQLAAWKDEDGFIIFDIRLPVDLPEGQRIFAVSRREPLQLSHEQGKVLGIPALEGSAEDLGEALRIKGWRTESDYGRRAMEMAASAHQKRAKAKEAQFRRDVERNVKAS